MASCTNCGKVLTCGCQRKTASDGKQCCSTCVQAYENRLKANVKPDDQVLTIAQKLRLNIKP